MADPVYAFESRQSKSGENWRNVRSHVDVCYRVDDWMLFAVGGTYCFDREVSLQPAGEVEFIEENGCRPGVRFGSRQSRSGKNLGVLRNEPNSHKTAAVSRTIQIARV